jgi:hypothetical protein
MTQTRSRSLELLVVRESTVFLMVGVFPAPFLAALASLATLATFGFSVNPRNPTDSTEPPDPFDMLDLLETSTMGIPSGVILVAGRSAVVSGVEAPASCSFLPFASLA